MGKIINLLIISLLLIVTLIIGGCATYREPAAPRLVLRPSSFTTLPNWSNSDPRPSLLAFTKSCGRILANHKYDKLGTAVLTITANELQPACQAAESLPASITPQLARQFFQHWFQPVSVNNNSQPYGLFTGYYVPSIRASLQRHGNFTVPVYGKPNDLITANLGLFRKNLKGITIAGRAEDGKLYPYNLSRAQINAGALNNKAPVLVWADNRIDPFFMEIQGSGIAELDNGKNILLGYAAKNNLPYTPIGRILVERGQLTKDNVSLQSIQAWLFSHLQQANAVMDTNASVVFFRILNGNSPVGAEKVELTPGYSLAVDSHYIPYGLPLWLDTKIPSLQNPASLQNMQRLMIAQDTGGAIKGPVRGDIYWGPGKEAELLAGYMKNPGRYWLLLPKTVAANIKEYS